MNVFRRTRAEKGNRPGPVIRCISGDITVVGTEVIVNAANPQLSAGGGVCGAIFSAAGHRDLGDACARHGGCPTGSAVATPSFRLESRGTRYVVHAVGPIFDPARAAECDEQLVSAYRSALRLAESLGARSIAIPAISTGIYRFPAERAAPLVAGLLSEETFDLDEIVLMASEPEKVDLYAGALAAEKCHR